MKVNEAKNTLDESQDRKTEPGFTPGPLWSKRPTVPGIYWWRADERDCEPEIHEIADGLVYRIESRRSEPLENYGGEWLGPISPGDVEQLARLRRVGEEALACLTMSRTGFTEWTEADDVINKLRAALSLVAVQNNEGE